MLIMQSIQEKADQIVKELNQFDDWLDKYQYIIDKGKELPTAGLEIKIDENLISGCQSKVWLTSEYRDGRVYFKGESDALITRGLVSIVIQVYSGSTPDEILSFEPKFIEQAGLSQHLSPTRNNGLLSMIKQIKLYALAWKIKNNPSTLKK